MYLFVALHHLLLIEIALAFIKHLNILGPIRSSEIIFSVRKSRSILSAFLLWFSTVRKRTKFARLQLHSVSKTFKR